MRSALKSIASYTEENVSNPSSFIILIRLYSSYHLLLLVEFEVSGEDVIHEVVKVVSINQPLSLEAWVHGGPAELVISHLTLHEAPHGATHHGHWLLARQDQDLTHCINLNRLPEKLAYTCMWVEKVNAHSSPEIRGSHYYKYKHIKHTDQPMRVFCVYSSVVPE